MQAQAQVQNAKLQLRGSPLQHFSTQPSRPPVLLFFPAALRCSCRRQQQLTYSPPRRTRLHPGSLGRWIRSPAYLINSVYLRVGISKHEPLPISSARDKTGHDKPI